MNQSKLSVVIPTLNESTNVKPLLSRLSRALSDSGIEWEAIVIDDHSTDATVEMFRQAASLYPVSVFSKQGIRGKAYSLLEGFARARYDCIAMLDADIQYPPEALPEMVRQIEEEKADIVVANRATRETTFLRRFLSRSFAFFFGKFLHGLDCDVQAGLKVFRRQILSEVKFDPTPWTFDLEFLLSARNYGYVIGGVPIVFAERQGGESKIKFFRAMYEIGWNALKLRFKYRAPLHIAPHTVETMIGAGIAHDRKRFVTHTTLPHPISALRTFAPWQRNAILLILAVLSLGFFSDPLTTGIIVIAFLSTVYFIDTFFNLGLVLRSLKLPPEIASIESELTRIPDEELPVYSILCPLYKEAHMLPGFVSAIENIKWPKEKLDVLLLLEENDPETVATARAMELPAHIRIVVVPHSLPKTKPKACNYGISLARGEYVVIYDAEDIPDPWQLRKAYLGFEKAGPSVKCLQAKLNYFNPNDNLLTRFFTAEYSLWFDIILVGLQSINTSIPLGGTSNHFRTKDLLELEGWDPFNVTEDCDLGVRIFKRGFRTAIIDSVTLEEANGHFFSWLRQRSRWIKGYMQTYLVHMRHPLQFVREQGIHALYFQLVVGGKLAFLFINPILWVTTIAYFTLYVYVGPTIQLLYPQWVFYMAAISLVFGNFFYIYYYMIGCAKRGHWSLIKYIFLVPLYWIMGSIAAYRALYELIVKPHYWQKTAHGSHLIQKETKKYFPTLVPALQTGWAIVVARAKEVVSPALWNFIFSSKGVLMVGLVFSNFINFIFNAFLGRVLSFEALSLVTLMSTLWFFVMIAMSALSSTINHRTAFLTASGDSRSAYHFYKATLEKAFLFSALITITWILFATFLGQFFRLHDPLAVLYFAPVFLLSVLLAGNRGFLQGNLHFTSLTILFLLESIVKLLLAGVFVFSGHPELVYLSIPLSIGVVAVMAWSIVRTRLPKEVPVSVDTTVKFPFRFYGASLLNNLSVIVFLSIDILLVNHYFAPTIAGQYALLSLVGKMIYFLGSLPNFFTVTFVSRNEGLKKESKKVFRFLYSMTLFTSVCGVIILGVFGGYTVPLLFGNKALTITHWLLPYTIAIGFFTLSGVIISYHLAKRHYAFSVMSFVIALLMVFGIIFSHTSLDAVVRVVLFTSMIGWGALNILHHFYRELRFVRRGLRDLVGLFFNGLPKNLPPLPLGKKRILIFNWRDTKHRFAGGAEIYVHEIAKEWVKEGNQVTLFCGNDGREKRHEIIDGIHIVRRGGFYLVYVWAFLYYIFRFRGAYDVVIDCENGIPFFTPIYVRKPIFCLLHHVHQDVFYYSLPRPLAWLASTLEKDIMPFFYKKVRFITVSESSKEEMQAIGIGEAGIQIVNPGITLSDHTTLLSDKTLHPSILYLGRLKAYKSVNILIQAFRMILLERPDAVLVIAGDGDERTSLERLAKELQLSEQQVRFLGSVSHQDKITLLQSAWVFVNPSFREGWGIVNIEANASGTPVIASDVPGLRDSVRDNETGYLVEYGNTKAFAEKILEVIDNNSLRDDLSNEARSWSKEFSWERASKVFYEELN